MIKKIVICVVLIFVIFALSPAELRVEEPRQDILDCIHGRIVMANSYSEIFALLELEWECIRNF